ncbi:MAG TPA: hypothetical protein DCZ95_18900 [Verrucomicrobia bacterium]|nr:MAG: hypothetical protein A2X46_17140 [Lentisphaerae bacterium GWF2_57_35]HBA86156.1 hypothetical protein [Verrucomicrobiota bacterium]
MATWAPVILAEGYELWRGPSNDVELAGLLGNASTSPYIDFTVTATQGNYYWVRATNSITSGTFSTPNFGYCGLPAPLGLVASDGVFTDRVTLSWSSVPGAEAYEVWRHTLDTTNGAGWLALWNASTNYADIVAVPGYRFYYWVKSKNQVGAGLISQSESGFLMLSPPSSVMASYGTVPNGVGVNWASVDGSDWYEVWWNDSSSTVGVEKIADCVAWTNYLDSEITPGMIGYYWIKASGTLSTSALSVAYDNGMIAGDPEIPESIGIATRLQGISLCCQTITGRSYRVQGTTNLMANWTNLYTTFTPGRGRLTSIFTTDIDSQLFLRVESTNSP